MTQNIYIVRGLGLGDDEDAYENLAAFTTLAEAEKQVEAFIAENAADGFDIEFEYDIEELILN